MSRDLAREAAFLKAAARGNHAFVAQAQARLEAGEEPYGDSWMWVGLRTLLREIAEEATDAGAWACLTDQALDREPELSDLHREQIRATLALVARRGAQAHEALSRALRSLERKAA